MIVRVKEICQIGGFREFKTGGSIQFSNEKPVTLVHSMNTLGKTTFAQVIKSLGSNESSLITKRQSIPAISGLPQKVTINYKTLAGVEETVTFSGGSWSNSELQGKILVFDQEFVNSHVMTGNSITRENKETFTDFILGNAGVKLSQEIEKNNKTLRADRASLSNFRPEFVQGAAKDSDVDDFVDMKISEDTSALEKHRETDEKRLRRLERIVEFQVLAEPVSVDISAEEDIEALQKEFTLILAEDYSQVSDEAWKILQNHIVTNCGGGVSWLKTGLKVKLTEGCPFCGQDLANAEVLIGAYQIIFDQKFEEFDTRLNTRVQQLSSNIAVAVAQSYVAPVNDFIKKAKEFNPFIPDLETELTKMDEEIKLLESLDEVYKLSLAEWGQKAKAELDEKLQSTHKSMKTSIDHTTLLSQSKEVAAKQSDIRAQQVQIRTHVINAKKKVEELKPEQFEEEKRTLTNQINDTKKQIARIMQDKPCAIYKTKCEAITKLKKQIDDDVEKLESDQSEYLEQYFEKLDYWFKQLGSNPNFTITKSTNQKGDKKVYTLALNFHGEKILPEDLSKVFSESDMRNLALSIFLSKADKLPSKNEYILLFDDPAVSFDDNRRKKTCRVIKDLSTEFRQIIVTTHYSSLVKHFVEQSVPSQYIEIVLDNNQSCFKVLDPTVFTLSPHQRECELMVEFVEGGAPIATKDFRPFMEEHLHQRYQSQLKTACVRRIGLDALIDKLSDLELISATSKNKLHGFRETYNPEHHRAGEYENVEEKRAEARELLNLLYGNLST